MYLPTPGVGVAVVANSVDIEEIVPPTVLPNNISNTYYSSARYTRVQILTLIINWTFANFNNYLACTE